MTASNHFITGVLAGAILPNPWIAIPVAFGSHFVLDTLPHYGYQGPAEKRRIGFTLFQWVLLLDLVMLAITLWALTYLIARPDLILFGIVAYSPDLVWVYKFAIQEKFGRRFLENKHFFTKFHAGLQHLENPWFIFIEVPLYVALLVAVVWVSA